MNPSVDMGRLQAALNNIRNAEGELVSMVPMVAEIAAGNSCAQFFADFFYRQNKGLPALGRVGNLLTIFEENGYSVALGVEAAGRARPQELCSVPQDCVIALVSDCCVHLEVFRSPYGAYKEFEGSLAVEHGYTKVLKRGSALFLDGNRDHIVTWSEQPYVTLVVSRQAFGRHLVTRHDSSTGQVIYAAAASQCLSRLQHACEYIANFGDVTLVPVLQTLLRHPAHFIRWKAVEALLNVDLEIGLRALDALREDPHPHIMAAANTAWARFQQDYTACR